MVRRSAEVANDGSRFRQDSFAGSVRNFGKTAYSAYSLFRVKCKSKIYFSSVILIRCAILFCFLNVPIYNTLLK